jgi:hypothetical protein
VALSAAPSGRCEAGCREDAAHAPRPDAYAPEFEFSQTQGFDGQGWSSQFSGYLSEEGRVFSLALHLALRGENSAPDLKPHLQKMLTRALARIEAEPGILTALREASAPA